MFLRPARSLAKETVALLLLSSKVMADSDNNTQSRNIFGLCAATGLILGIVACVCVDRCRRVPLVADNNNANNLDDPRENQFYSLNP